MICQSKNDLSPPQIDQFVIFTNLLNNIWVSQGLNLNKIKFPQSCSWLSTFGVV